MYYAIIIFVIFIIKNLVNEDSLLIILIHLMIQLINMRDLMIGAISDHPSERQNILAILAQEKEIKI